MLESIKSFIINTFFFFLTIFFIFLDIYIYIIFSEYIEKKYPKIHRKIRTVLSPGVVIFIIFIVNISIFKLGMAHFFNKKYLADYIDEFIIEKITNIF